MLKRLLVVLTISFVPAILPAQQVVTVRVHAAEPQGAFEPVWAYVGHDEPNYTYSPEGRDLLSKLSVLSPYPVHDRTHNLLTTGNGTPALKWGSTNAFTLDASGRPVYNWTIFDKIFDAYRDLNITPYVEIGFMPEALSTHPEPYQHHYPHGPLFTGWSYPPRNYMEWSDLIYQWVRHAIERYGRERVRTWDWEVWNEPNIGYWHGTLDEYCKLYDYTTAAVKRALPEAPVGGPASTGPASPKAAQFLKGFLTHCVSGKNYATGKIGAPLDFISFHAKGRTRMVDGHVQMDIRQNLRDVDRGFAIIASFPKLRNLPVVISESDPEGCAACAAMTHPENGYRNTSQYASYEAQLLDGELALARRDHIRLQGVATWAFTFPGQPYFAGFRALTTHNIDKPLLNLFRMLGLMGGQRIAAQSSGALSLDMLLESGARSNPDINVMATRKGQSVSVLVWNYDDDATVAPPVNTSLAVDGLPQAARRVLCENFRVGPDLSNSYAAWKAMGSPQNPSPEEYAKLKAAGQLHLLGSPQWLRSEDGAVKLKFLLPRQGVSLVYLRW